MAAFFVQHPALAIAAVIALGAGAQWLAWRLHLPAILPLLTAGFLVGPVLGWMRPSQIFGDALLYPAVSLAVGLVLFEGGLTLRLSELRETRRVILYLVTVGAAVTWLGSAAAAHWLGALPGPLALLFGALVIVTGPTVIGPLLRIVRPTERVGNVLKWEGIIIDVVGAMVAVLVFEALLLGSAQAAPERTVLLLGRFLLVGAAAGTLAGYALAWLLKRRAMPDYLINVVSLATLFAAFTLSNVVTDESGLLAAVVMVVWLSRLSARDRLGGMVVSLILGGALGNVIDRVWHGRVIDFIDVYYRHWHWPAFNVADSAITIGVALLIIDGLLGARSAERQS